MSVPAASVLPNTPLTGPLPRLHEYGLIFPPRGSDAGSIYSLSQLYESPHAKRQRVPLIVLQFVHDACEGRRVTDLHQALVSYARGDVHFNRS